MEPGKDKIKLKDYLLSLIDFSSVEAALDLGCGNGYDLLKMAERCSSKDARLVGVDARKDVIERAIDDTDKCLRHNAQPERCP